MVGKKTNEYLDIRKAIWDWDITWYGLGKKYNFSLLQMRQREDIPAEEIWVKVEKCGKEQLGQYVQ